MRRIFVSIGLEAYAIILALLQAQGGVRTDEAKYLLNIPYPHPPAVRYVLSLLDGLAYQELIIRILFASLLVQAVWIIWDMAKDLSGIKRVMLTALWLLSGGVLLQAGTVMMAPLTALQALVLLWMAKRKASPMLVGLFWIFSLFTAYQAVLFLPIVITCLSKRCSLRMVIIYTCIPIILLVLYTLTNPLIPASMITHGSRDLGSPIGGRLFATGRLWAVGGSMFLSIIGTWGIIKSGRWALLASLFLVLAYVALSRYDYYAVLFLPLFVGGVLARPALLTYPKVAIALSAAVGFSLAATLFIGLSPSAAKSTVQFLEGMDVHGSVLIQGSFGHEWQYESPWEVRRFSEGLVGEADIVVCLQACPEWNKQEWKTILFEPEVWVRSQWLSKRVGSRYSLSS